MQKSALHLAFLIFSGASLLFLLLFNPLLKPAFADSGKTTYKIGIQAGHWKNREVPSELENIRYGDGAHFDGIMEWEVNYTIASLTADILRARGMTVDLLPATIPPNYTADLFIAIHADQNPTEDYSGFKMASPWYQSQGVGKELVNIMEDEYYKATKMPTDSHITRGMTEYYAFNYLKFEHSINPKTPAIIIETGFLPNKNDQKIILDHPKIAALGIADGATKFLQEEKSNPQFFENMSLDKQFNKIDIPVYGRNQLISDIKRIVNFIKGAF